MITVDATGLSCPEPLMLAKQATKDNPSQDVTVLVDSATARDNILRMAHGIGRATSLQENDGVYTPVLARP